ncbi:hypothetical protein [Acinetobacter pittii]|uniref:Uncharacterized protein n=1 Tax=Acinetobacter pittii TaxID=48296 RepID=A0A6H0G053_ACIPI|nr:hypothetical protein [Acinetobacter pittii]QIT20005.1 hypothetical protein G8E09_19540 [Acinetobacter pittii]
MTDNQYELTIFDFDTSELVTLVQFDAETYSKIKKEVLIKHKDFIKNRFKNKIKKGFVFFFSIAATTLLIWGAAAFFLLDSPFIEIISSPQFYKMWGTLFLIFTIIGIPPIYMRKLVSAGEDNLKPIEDEIKVRLLKHFNINNYNNQVDKVMLTKNSEFLN